MIGCISVLAAGILSVLISAICFAGLTSVPARAADDDSVYEAVAGKWLFASEQTGRGCVVTLSTIPTPMGRALFGVDHCPGAATALGAAAVWDFDAGMDMVLRDLAGKTLLTLSEDDDGNYFQTTRPRGKRLVLLSADEGQERLVTVADMAGTWVFRRPGGAAICSVTFSRERWPSTEEFYALTMAPDCDAGLQKLKLIKWHIEAALLVMVGGETADLTLVPKANGSFLKSAKEGGKPLELVRK